MKITLKEDTTEVVRSPSLDANRTENMNGENKQDDMLGVRHLQVLKSFVAIVIAYILRVNMSVAIVSMTDEIENSNITTFRWTEAEKGTILSSFFWGYILLPIWFGNLSEKYGSKLSLTAGMVTSSILTMIIPYFAKFGYLVVCILRILEGVAQSSFFPAIMVLLSKWIPPQKRAQALTIAFSGMSMGTLLGFPLSGFLASTEYGWPSIFYVTGGIGILWVIIWLWIGASSPSGHRFISDNEHHYIRTSLTNIHTEEKLAMIIGNNLALGNSLGKSVNAIGTENEKLKTPWKYVLTSAPAWAINIVHFGQNWGYFTLLTEIPHYIHSVLKVKIEENGVLSALPYICGWISAISFSWISHQIEIKSSLSKTVLRKIWNSIALWGGALVLFTLGMLNTRDITTTVGLLIICITLNSGIYPGFLTSHVDVSPNFCGTLIGISNMLGNTAAIFGPLTVGWIVDEPTLQRQWRYVFVLASVIDFISNSIYVIFGSSEVQNWNDPEFTK